MRTALVVPLLVILSFSNSLPADMTRAPGLLRGESLADPSSRDIAQTIWYQGFLADATTGDPVNATYDVVASIYDADVDGTLLWGPETHAATPIVEGWFNVELGATLGFPGFSEPPYYIEITVNGEVLEPRQKLGSVPSAFVAESAEAAPADQDWYFTGAGIYRTDGYVGIGVTMPEYDLDVEGTINTSAFRMPIGASAGHVLTSDGDGVGTWMPPPGGDADADWTISGDDMYSAVAGNVGVGVTTPAAKLEVIGDDEVAVEGTVTVASGVATGLQGIAEGSTAHGVRGEATAPGATAYGLYGTASAPGGSAYGLHADASVTDGTASGVFGSASSSVAGASSYGLYGYATGVAGPADVHGVHGTALFPQETATGVFGVGGGIGVRGVNQLSSAEGHLGTSTAGVYGSAGSGRAQWAGLFDGNVYINARLGVGTTLSDEWVRIEAPYGHGLRCQAPDTTYYTVAISGVGWATLGAGVHGRTQGTSAYGVHGEADGQSSIGVYGTSTMSAGVKGRNLTTGASGGLGNGDNGVYGSDGGDPSNLAGRFDGQVWVDGDLGVGTFAPDDDLHVSGHVNDAVAVRISNTNTGSSSQEQLLFADEAGVGGSIVHYDDGSAWPNLFRILNQRSNGPLVLGTEGIDRLRIAPDGNVGIGGTATDAKLYVKTDSQKAIYGWAQPDGTNLVYGVYGGTGSDYGYGVYGISGEDGGVMGQCAFTATTGKLGTYTQGVYGSDGGNDTRWGGYFDGNVHVSDRIGIGTTTPSAALDCDDLIRIRGVAWPAADTGKSMELAYNPATHRGYIQVYDRDAGGDEWGQLWLGDGHVGIGSPQVWDPQYKLSVIGKATCQEMYEYSDGRLKANVRPIDDPLGTVDRLRGIAFEWSAESESVGAIPGEPGVGLIAQEVEDVLPSLVSTPREGYKSLDYAKLTAVLVEAVKELRQENRELRERVEALESHR
jgi:hypothetical protein